MHTLVEEQAELLCPCKWAFWEALRLRADTIGARCALDEAVALSEGRFR